MLERYFLDRHPEYPERTPSSIEEDAEGVSKGAGSKQLKFSDYVDPNNFAPKIKNSRIRPRMRIKQGRVLNYPDYGTVINDHAKNSAPLRGLYANQKVLFHNLY